MNDSNSSAAEADENQQDRSHKKSQARIVGVHPLYLLLPKEIPSLLSPATGSTSLPGDTIPVTGEKQAVVYTSRFVTPYLRQDRAYPAGSLPPLVLDNLQGMRSILGMDPSQQTRTNQ